MPRRTPLTLLVLCSMALLTSMSLAQSDSFVDSLPDHLVKWKMVKLPDNKDKGIKDLWIGETEVPWELFEVWALRLDLTQEQQATGVDATSRPSKPYSVIFTNFGHHSYPAICMSFLNAQKFCEWLSQKTGKTYRLPKENEWEYACLAGGQQAVVDDGTSWNWENADDVTHPIGQKTANAWGLKDMVGNVAEWCVGADGSNVVRGGSWKTKLKDLGHWTSEKEAPSWNEADPQNPKSKWWLANGQFVGLRIVCEQPGTIEGRQ